VSRMQYDIFDLKRRVSEALYYIRDPIGVNNNPMARSEYESYVPEILKLVEESEDIKPISGRLSKIASVGMVLSPDTVKCDLTAELLKQHKVAIKEGST